MDPEGFIFLSEIRNPEIIAAGRGVHAKKRLRLKHGGDRWRKMKGVAWVQEDNGEVYEAEIHWFEAHGIGKRDWKIKRRIN